ncbi:General transcription factor 3C polypeptide 5 [Perkinsus olseni]|uniref:General transcription factor 3C polypeptide 5 n=1 Tax=Perkinsus olseni TaxID=32597 RepID=A0A7J6NBG1_PEROL|nr:General transcription factor 3C polypeptide 5 [Perkinsus olseni]
MCDFMFTPPKETRDTFIYTAAISQICRPQPYNFEGNAYAKKKKDSSAAAAAAETDENVEEEAGSGHHPNLKVPVHRFGDTNPVPTESSWLLAAGKTLVPFGATSRTFRKIRRKCSVVVVHAEPAWSHLIRIPNSSAWLLFAYRDELPTDGGSTAQRSLLTAPPALYWVLWLALGLLYPAIFPFETIAVDYYVGDWGMTQQRAGMVVSTRPFWPLRSPLSSTVLTTVKGTQ